MVRAVSQNSAQYYGAVAFEPTADGLDYKIRINALRTPRTDRMREAVGATYGSYTWHLYSYSGFVYLQV
jgi:hypothetical protein